LKWKFVVQRKARGDGLPNGKFVATMRRKGRKRVGAENREKEITKELSLAEVIAQYGTEAANFFREKANDNFERISVSQGIKPPEEFPEMKDYVEDDRKQIMSIRLRVVNGEKTFTGLLLAGQNGYRKKEVQLSSEWVKEILVTSHVFGKN